MVALYPKSSSGKIFLILLMVDMEDLEAMKLAPFLNCSIGLSISEFFFLYKYRGMNFNHMDIVWLGNVLILLHNFLFWCGKKRTLFLMTF